MKTVGRAGTPELMSKIYYIAKFDEFVHYQRRHHSKVTMSAKLSSLCQWASLL